MPRLQPIHRALRVLALAGLLACGNAPHGAPADLVVYGRIWTGDSAAPWAAALAVSGDTVRAVGDSASIAPLVGPATRVLGRRWWGGVSYIRRSSVEMRHGASSALIRRCRELERTATSRSIACSASSTPSRF